MKRTFILTVAFCLILASAAAGGGLDDFAYQGRLLSTDSQGVNAVVFSPDAKMLVSGHDDGSIAVWETASGKKLTALGGYQVPMFSSGSRTQGAINSLAFSPDGKLLVTGSRDGEVSVWDAATWKKMKTIRSGEAVNAVIFSPDGKMLAAGGNDTVISFRDTATWEKAKELKGHSDWINALAYSKDGKYLASGSKDRTIIVWDAATGNRVHFLDGRSRAVESIDFSPDGKMLASGGNYPNILLWDLARGSYPRLVPTMQRSRVLSLKYLPDSKILVAGYQNGRVDLWEMGVSPAKKQLAYREKPVNSVALSADGKMLATGDGAGGVMLWTAAGPSVSRAESGK